MFYDKSMQLSVSGKSLLSFVFGCVGCIAIAVVTASVVHAQCAGIVLQSHEGLFQVGSDGREESNILNGQMVDKFALDELNEHIYFGKFHNALSSATILRSKFDGSKLAEILTVEILTSDDLILDIAFDPVNKKIIWSDAFKIHRANLDGSDIEELPIGSPVAPRKSSTSIVVHEQAKKMYWREVTSIHRSNLDGSDEEIIIDSVDGVVDSILPLGIAINVAAGKLYWSEQSSGKLYSSDLSGENTVELFDAPSVVEERTEVESTRARVEEVFFDRIEQNIYIQVFGMPILPSDAFIFRLDTQGLGVELLSNGVLPRVANMKFMSLAQGIIVDKPEGERSTPFFFTTDKQNAILAGKVLTTSHSGSKIELFDRPIRLLVSPSEMALAPDRRTLYVADGKEILHVDLASDKVKVIVSGLAGEVSSLALNPITDQIYWTIRDGHLLERANTDGTGRVIIRGFRSGPTGSRGMAIDAVNGKIYFASLDKIQRSNLDLSNVENIVLGTQTAWSIEVDSTTQKIYWGEDGVIKRASLDGSNIELLVSLPGLPVGDSILPAVPRGMELDHILGKLYFIDLRQNKIKRVNIDGTGLEDVFDRGGRGGNALGLLPSCGADGETIGDVENDEITDFGVWRPSDGNWYVQQSSLGFSSNIEDLIFHQWGMPFDIPVPSDLDGDGLLDLTVWRPLDGFWFMCPSSQDYNCFNASAIQFGLPGDYPLASDFDGDGRNDLAVWRSQNLSVFGAWWYYKSSFSGATVTKQWGLPGDVPVAADYDGDGKTDFAVWRPVNGTWYLLQSSSDFDSEQARAISWGLPGDHPIPGDYDGDGRIDLAVWRPSNGFWFVCPSSSNFDCSQGTAAQFGLFGDRPVSGDFDGDGKYDLAVWRPQLGHIMGMWYYRSSSTGKVVIRQWGWPWDLPLNMGVRDRMTVLGIP